ncbi:50S ribosomal protein L4 [Flindersiella endophytica]
MTTVDVLNAEGSKAGSVDLPEEIFEVQVNVPLIHQVVVGQLAASRQGTAKAKTRGEVSGGGAKPYRQKGTGRARQGSRRAPHFTGGGVVHGPQPRNYEQRTPKKMKAAALRGALSDRARHGRVHVVSSLIDGDVPSTKTAMAAITKVTERKNVLVVLHRDEDVAWFSLRNAASVHILVADQLNTYDVLISDDVIFTAKAYQQFTGIEVEVKAPAKKAAAKKAAAADDAEEKPAKKAAAKKTAAKKTAAKKTAKAADADAEKEADA